MRSSFIAISLTALILIGAAFASPTQASGTSHATAFFSPSKVPIGGTTRLRGTHLKPSTYYELLLVVPVRGKSAIERLFGLVKSNASGTVSSSVHIPVVTQCGAASVFLYPIRQNKGVRARLTLTRCSASKKLPPPPKPASTSKGKSKKKTPPPPP